MLSESHIIYLKPPEYSLKPILSNLAPMTWCIIPAISGLPVSGTGSPDGHVAVQHGGYRSMTCLGGPAEQPVSREHTPHYLWNHRHFTWCFIDNRGPLSRGACATPSFAIN